LKRIRAKVRFDACAILASGEALFGMMRVFEAQAEEFFRVTRTFRIATEAEAWLTRMAGRTQAGGWELMLEGREDSSCVQL